MDDEKNVKAIDAIYKNILEKFNPESKKMLMNAKTYLKALHNSSQASKIFSESLGKIAENAQTTQGVEDIGSALLKIIEVFKFIEEQHQQIFKAFYVDFICPLETNLTKDMKVIQAEQKKFAHQHKIRVDSFEKATAAVKKHRKKKNNAERELKCIQILEEEKKNLDNFMMRESKNALLQERRRYGFILERYTESLAKHYLHFYNNSFESINHNIQRWNEVAATREIIVAASNCKDTLKKNNNNNNTNSSSSVNNNQNNNDNMRKDIENFNQRRNLERASLSLSEESESNLSISNKNEVENGRTRTRFSMDKVPTANLNGRTVVALYGHLSNQENQLNFAEGDKICLIGDNLNGWQFGENIKTKTFGWFPVSYIDANHQKNTHHTSKESEIDEDAYNSTSKYHSVSKQRKFQNPPSARAPSPPSNNNVDMDVVVMNGLRGMYSSNDSGFDNEGIPIAPEVDYSDDDNEDDDDDDDRDHMPQKIPIRNPIMNEGFMSSSGQSNSYGDLTESIATMKKNKAFWRFSKSEDLLEGMGMWKHRDLLTVEGEDEDTRSKKSSPSQIGLQYKKSSEKFIPKTDVVSQMKKNSKDKSQEERTNADENNIYDETPKKRHHTGPINKDKKNFYKEIQDTNFYDDDDEVLLRTVKRKEILKQYHSSETDTEISISSDPYDCILQKNNNNNTLLPRTKLSSKSKNNESYDLTLKSTTSALKTKAYEPWRNF